MSRASFEEPLEALDVPGVGTVKWKELQRRWRGKVSYFRYRPWSKGGGFDIELMLEKPFRTEGYESVDLHGLETGVTFSHIAHDYWGNEDSQGPKQFPAWFVQFVRDLQAEFDAGWVYASELGPVPADDHIDPRLVEIHVSGVKPGTVTDPDQLLEHIAEKLAAAAAAQ